MEFDIRNLNASLKYALIITSLSASWKTMLFLTGLQYKPFGRYYLFGYLLFILLGIYFGMKKNTPENNSSLKQNIKSGVQISALNAFFFSVFTFAYYKWIDAAFFSKKISELISGLPPETSTENIEKATNFTQMFYTASFFSTSTLVGFLATGTFYTLIFGFLFKKGWIR